MKNINLISIIILLALSPLLLHSQDLYIPNNPYDKADDYTKTKNSFNRERWFYEQRMFPNNFIPSDAYEKAFEQKNELRKKNGFMTAFASPWVLLGPTPGFYFNYSNISGRTTSARYHPVNPNIIYIGGAFGGLWKTTNGGLNWSPKADFQPSLSTGSIAIDPANPNVILYGTGEATYSGASYYGRGIFRSTNGGDNWILRLRANGLPNLTYCSRIVFKPGSSSIVYAAMGTSGLYKSLDSGKTWTQVISGRCDDIVFNPTGTNAYITGSGTGYRISTDGGNTFTTNTSVTMGTRNHIAICKAQPTILYIAVYSSSAITVYKSTDSGANFTQVAVGVNFNGGQAWYDFYMHVNPFDPNYAYVGSIDIWRTTDGGVTFANITNGYSNGNVHVDEHNIDFNPINQDEMICTNDGGVWKSTDRGTTWTNLNATLTLTQFYRMTSDPSNSNHLLGGTQDNGTQRTTGTINWAAAFGGDGGEVCFNVANPLYMLGETQNNGVRRSTDGGVSWASATGGLSGSGSWVGPLISHPSEAQVFFTGRQQVFKTTDGGALWTAISTGISGTIREMAISRSNPQIILASASNTLFKSTDGGVTFNSITPGSPGRTITSVYIHPDSSNVFLATFSGFGAGKVSKTTNGGTSWFDISGDLPDSPTNDVLIYYPGFATSYYLAAMDIGVFLTTNYGASWTELADGLPNTVAMHLDYNLLSNKIRIGTHGRGTWETSITITGIVHQNNEIPNAYNLGQNYPNPFNPMTFIKYSVKDAGLVKLSIYDMLGREASKVVNQFQNAGTYTVQVDGSNLSSGAYFYKLTVTGSNNTFTETKKMVLSK
jgi:photosystem II stability/assembly factor-like uncharacterized protein